MNSDRSVNRTPLGVYLHIPFCVKKCLYCDFLSFPSDDTAREAYVNALLREIDAQSALYGQHQVQTIFFGGGTPSLLTAGQIDRLLSRLAFRFHFAKKEEMEVTLEANPGTVSGSFLASCRRSGVNRLSFGLQSASDGELKALGRIHTWQDFLESWRAAQEAGFTNLNLDLMSALPGQTLDSWMDTLRRAAELEPAHLSAYSLIVEEGTPFYELYGEEGAAERRGFPPLPDEEEERRMYEQTGEFLARRGYGRYEISNYARPGYQCRHNLSYWKRVDYAGFGLGAASLRQNVRWSNTRSMEEYLACCADTGLETPMKKDFQRLSLEEQMEEFMFLGLRMTDGVAEKDFQRAFGRELEEVYGKAVEKLAAEGLLSHEKGRYRLTERGVDVSNYALAEFLF